jgi:hypothetical protein
VPPDGGGALREQQEPVMPNHRIFLAASLLAALGLSQGCSDDDDLTAPVLETEFTATLIGASERPNPVTTTATGTATVTIVNENSLTFTVTVANLTNITAGHIHVGSAAVAGAVIVGLAPATLPTGTFTGILNSGTITVATLAGAPVTMASLIALIRNGDAYINVHTTANPGGEIRGQLVPQ